MVDEHVNLQLPQRTAKDTTVHERLATISLIALTIGNNEIQ